MKQIILLFALLVFAGTVYGQQDAQYTQFMYNKLAFNPAVAGSPESALLRVNVRQQWLGLNEAPSSQIATYNAPLTSSGTGVAARLSRVSIGLEQQYNVEGSYAYRVSLGRGSRLGFGLSASARYFNVEYDRARPTQGGGIDTAIPGASESKIVPNFGAGVYLDGPNYYLGIGAPRLLQTDIDLGSEETIISRETRHFYFMGGFKMRAGEKIVLEPQMLAKYVTGAPFDADFNLTAYLGSSFFTGLSYRLGGNGAGESASALGGLWLGEHLSLCVAYDLGLSDLKTYQDGSLELVVTYSIGGRSNVEEVIDPRSL